VICLFYVAPSTQAAIAEKVQAPCYGLGQFIGDYMSWGWEAWAVTETWIRASPRHRGLYWCFYLAERFYREEALHLCMLRKALDFLIGLRQEWSKAALEVEALMPEPREAIFKSLLASYSGFNWVPSSMPGYFITGEGRLSLGTRLGNRLRASFRTGGWERLAGDVRHRNTHLPDFFAARRPSYSMFLLRVN
jgi:hypothetical protein